jgi:hypothetical protein
VTGSHGNRGFPDAAWTKKGDEPLFAKAILNFAKNEVAPDHPAGARRQAAPVTAVWTIGFAIFWSNHGADKRIAPALDVRDVPVSEFAVPKRFSDRRNVDAEASLLDDDVRPDVINELFLRYDLAGTLSEIDQDIERPAAKGKDDTIALKDPLAARKLERTKLQFSLNAIACHGSNADLGFSEIPTIGTKQEFAPTCRYWPAAVIACNCITGARPGDRSTSLYLAIPTLPSREL